MKKKQSETKLLTSTIQFVQDPPLTWTLIAVHKKGGGGWPPPPHPPFAPAYRPVIGSIIKGKNSLRSGGAPAPPEPPLLHRPIGR